MFSFGTASVINPHRAGKPCRVRLTPAGIQTACFVRAIFKLLRGMNWKRKTFGGVMGFIGFMLSPLSWWNDLFVNVPLAVAFAWGVSLLYKPAFFPAAILGYWLTNVLGFVLMHKGAQKILSEKDKPYGRRRLFLDVLISLLYTLLIVVLIKLGVLKPVTDYFQQK